VQAFASYLHFSVWLIVLFGHSIAPVTA
jgi:hypothetical protein